MKKIEVGCLSVLLAGLAFFLTAISWWLAVIVLFVGALIVEGYEHNEK